MRRARQQQQCPIALAPLCAHRDVLLASLMTTECVPHQVRCLFAGRDVLFIGNSVMRRQVFTLLDVLAGPAAQRLSVNGGETVNVSTSDGTPAMAPSELLSNTRLWDLDGHEHGYHAAQLLTIDLATGAHRFHLPHSELCGVERAYANFNAGRARQWWSPSAQVIATDGPLPHR